MKATPEQKATRKIWRLANPEKIRAAGERYAAKYPEKLKEHERRRRGKRHPYYLKNKEKIAARREVWRLAHPERWRAMALKSIKKNPQGNADRSARRRARMKGVEVEKVDRLMLYERDAGVCHLCRKHVDRAVFTLDHVIPIVKGGPHTPANLKVAHKSCNSSKRDGDRRRKHVEEPLLLAAA